MEEVSREYLEKRVAAQEVQSQEQLKVKSNAKTSLNELLEGKKTINETRVNFGLLPLEDESANARLTKVEFDNNMELD